MNLIHPAEMFVKIIGDPVRGHLNAEANVPPLQAVTMCLQAALVMAQKHAEQASMIVGLSKGNGEHQKEPAQAQQIVVLDRLNKIGESLAEHSGVTQREIQHIRALLSDAVTNMVQSGIEEQKP